MGCQKAYGRRKANGAPKKKHGRQKANGAPKRRMDAIKGKWDAKKANGMPKRHWGTVRLWISARWGRDTSVLRLMAAHCFGLAPGGGARLEYCVKYATCSHAVCNMPAQKSQLAGLQATQLAGAMLQYRAQWLARGWVSRQWLARGLGIAPNGWHKAEYHAKWLL